MSVRVMGEGVVVMAAAVAAGDWGGENWRSSRPGGLLERSGS